MPDAPVASVADPEPTAVKPKRERKPKAVAPEVVAQSAAMPPEQAVEPVAEKPKRVRKVKADANSPVVEPMVAAAPIPQQAAPQMASAIDADNSGEEPRRGWWQRTFGE